MKPAARLTLLCEAAYFVKSVAILHLFDYFDCHRSIPLRGMDGRRFEVAARLCVLQATGVTAHTAAVIRKTKGHIAAYIRLCSAFLYALAQLKRS